MCCISKGSLSFCLARAFKCCARYRFFNVSRSQLVCAECRAAMWSALFPLSFSRPQWIILHTLPRLLRVYNVWNVVPVLGWSIRRSHHALRYTPVLTAWAAWRTMWPTLHSAQHFRSFLPHLRSIRIKNFMEAMQPENWGFHGCHFGIDRQFYLRKDS